MDAQQRDRALALAGATRAAGALDDHGHLHAPKGRFGGRFISKTLQAALGHQAKLTEHRAPSKATVSTEPKALAAPRARGPGRSSEVRSVLAGATSTREVSAAATAEAQRITGRAIPFEFGGSDPQVAREHAEGVLRGLERFPHARLHAVGVADLSAAVRGDEGFHTSAWARTRELPDGSSRIDFDIAASSPLGAAEYRRDLAASVQRRRMGRGHTTGDPVGNGLHEFGHVVAGNGPFGINAKARHLADEFVDRSPNYTPSADEDRDRALRRLTLGLEVSTYATQSPAELTAEALADVMAHGDDASVLSRLIADLIDDEVSRP